ncbi:chromosome partition protein Smc [Clostridium acetireducens DSM 10703]|jgi:predicted  nucleic acid-binding Zn-ribbon protein|uniref:Chromosome partition protein Smc n=1 Tax=Clostridium acetireducens DSM 10703 TaxID=1121290 RepID=A0A1E8F150_9CLOT|nr:C4-type zinc ribbon domain-containing protein [Clostridium acetireducens]OFI07165.1 chromosome partition protein Smc [Clostridium acetireducens DSM 10703]
MYINELLKIQENYNKIIKCNKVLKDNYCIQLLKKLKIEFEEKKKKYKEIEKELKSMKSLYETINEKENELNQKLKEDEYNLYNNAGSDFKLIKSLQERIKKSKLELNEIESKEIKILEKYEKIENDKKVLRKELEKLRDSFNNFKEESINKINKAKEDIKKSKEDIEKLEKSIDKLLLKEFKRIQCEKGETAISKVKNGVCLGCSMKVSSQTLDKLNIAKEIVYCDNCGRILYK